MEETGHSFGVRLGVDRANRGFTPTQALVHEFGIGFLDVTGISQHDVAQIGCGAGGIDGPRKALPNQVRQIAAVVNVRV